MDIKKIYTDNAALVSDSLISSHDDVINEAFPDSEAGMVIHTAGYKTIKQKSLDGKWVTVVVDVSSGGERGEDGDSAYEIAVRYGYKGSEEEWINSLKGDKGDVPTIKFVPRRNSNAYQFTKKDTTFNTIRWADEADTAIERKLTFSAKVNCHYPYFTHSWRFELRKPSEYSTSAITMLAIGSDGAGNTVVYDCSGQKLLTTSEGWHKYSISVNCSTGLCNITVDDSIEYSSASDELIMSKSHGIQISQNAFSNSIDDLLSIDYFILEADGKEIFNDTFDSDPIGAIFPYNWSKNDNQSNNIREVVLDTDKDLYIEIENPNGEIIRTGNLKGKNGQDGHTPVKGVDYFTESDKEEIINAVLAAVIDK